MPTESKDQKPPYVTFATFNNYLNGARDSGILPSRIDRSVLLGMAGGVQTYLISALRFLGLVDDQKVPTQAFKDLVDAKDEDQKKAVLKQIVEKSYRFIFDNGIDLKRATDSQLTEVFKATGTSGDTIRKCISFFTGIAASAGIELGPHLKSSGRSGNGNSGRVVRRKTPRREPAKKTPPKVEGSGNSSGGTETILDKLLAKFPEFNPEWDAKIKEAWFKDFSELRKMGETS